jgi:glycosyltransferase involved in cell wall biosynthesis
MRLAVLTSHPIQYHAPLFRELALTVDLHVLFAHRPGPAEQVRAGYDRPFEWDVDLTSGYAHTFLENVARRPGTDRFIGCDTPDIARHLRAGRFQALLVTGWHLKAHLQGILAAKRIGIPVMVRSDSQLETPRSALKKALKQIVYPRLLRLLDAALYVGRRSRAYLAHFRYPADRLFFSPHCVDARWFRARATAAERERLRSLCSIPSDARVLLFAGRLVPFKRPVDVVLAAARQRARGLKAEVMVAGSGALEADIRSTAGRLGVPLHLLGFCNQSAMPAAYAAADCLVLPSDGSETWGLVANEALACGRPIVVSSACGCAPDLAADGSVGRTHPTANADALADAIGDLFAAPPSPSAITALSATYSIEAAVAGIVAAVERIAPNR